ncbi:MAG: aminoacyl-tRNA hydrolase [Gemmatimonadetes bacterium]|nr:aminoacyl-tRNA hydrolase [Gemmatimonadota bacterium]
MTHSPSEFGLLVAPGIEIPEAELSVQATRAGGPGGQHVNTSSTRVELVWALATSRVVNSEQRTRIRTTLSGRLDAEGNLRIVASDTRSQRQNRELARRRLVALVAKALKVAKARRKTRPPKSAVERRLTEKKHRADRKRDRRGGSDE